jgi:L-alanine-DL-glutamate epimerase-like enolase superfamily enzyme
MTTASRIDKVAVSAYVIPTDAPESDGTLEWDQTTLVLVEIYGGGKRGIGFTYADTATAHLIHHRLADLALGRNPMDIRSIGNLLARSTRNLGRPGITSMAISAIDIALWDLKARLLELPLCKLLGMVRDRIPIYGSGGFTSYSIEELQKQLQSWHEMGARWVKMKVGRQGDRDIERVIAARKAVGDGTGLFVDANGAYDRREALRMANGFATFGVTWFEEPVTSTDLQGLSWLRDRSPSILEIAAGEYGYELHYFRRMLEVGAVDVLQADATRCGGISGFLQAGVLAEAFRTPFSSHCAPQIHLHVACAVGAFRHAEYFYDHARIEQMLFEGTMSPIGGDLQPDLSRPGLGIEFKRKDAEKYRVTI